MCKATNKADAYSITKDAKTKAFNIKFNGVYSNEIRKTMFDHHFKWSKANSCFYGWTKDIQSLSNQIQKLVFDWRNKDNKAKFIDCPVILEKDIEVMDIYKNKKEYVEAIQKADKEVMKITVNELMNDVSLSEYADIFEKIKEEELTLEEDKKQVTNSDELKAAIDEVKQNWIHWSNSELKTWEDFTQAMEELAKGVELNFDLSNYKYSQYANESGITHEELVQKILYSCYSPEETAKHVKVTKLDKEVMLRGVHFCNLKCCNIEEVEEYIKEDEDFDETMEVMAVQGYIDFDSEIEYQKFIHCGLMHDQTWLTGEDNHFGGGASINLATLELVDDSVDTYHMCNEQRKAKNIGVVTAGVIVRLNGVNQIAIDPEGYTYARYVGILPDHEVKYTPSTSEFYLSKEEKELIEQAKRDKSFSIIDFGARRSTNENFWNELKKLGQVKIEPFMWSFEGMAA